MGERYTYEGLVEGSAEARGNPPVERRFITEALQRIADKLEVVPRYPTGSPTLKGIYDIATRLEAAAAIKQ
jgi:hypothetical protein